VSADAVVLARVVAPETDSEVARVVLKLATLVAPGCILSVTLNRVSTPVALHQPVRSAHVIKINVKMRHLTPMTDPNDVNVKMRHLTPMTFDTDVCLRDTDATSTLRSSPLRIFASFHLSCGNPSASNTRLTNSSAAASS
jgi:hypothetical protein